MPYTLYNKFLKKNLTHPVVGLWYTNDLEEAKEMLKSCKEHIVAIVEKRPQNVDLAQLSDAIVIIDAETEKEI